MDARPRRDQRGDPAATAEAAALSSPHALVVLLSPLTHPDALAAVATLARSGRSVVAVDTLPTGPAPGPAQRLDAAGLPDLAAAPRRPTWPAAEQGVPVVAWGGAGSLDQVLRDATRAARAARTAR